MQAALRQLEQVRKKPTAQLASRAKPKWNSSTAKPSEASETVAPERDLSRIAPIISQLQTSLQERSEAVTDLEAQLAAMKADVDASGQSLEFKTSECQVCF